MTWTIWTVFTPKAESLLQGAQALRQFDYEGFYPIPGDLLTLRIANTGPAIRVRCTERHLDFSATGAPVLTLTMDSAA